MPSTQQLLQAITGLQQNAQANLPVIPNNGNPRGANNMPAVNPQAPQTAPSPYFYEWMQPSSSMEIIQQLLAQPIKSSFAAPITTQYPTTNMAVLPTMPQAVGTIPMGQQGLPPLPRRIPGQY